MHYGPWSALVLSLLATPVVALTPADVATTAAKAHAGLRTVVRKLAGDRLQGRDNNTQGSIDAQTWLIRKLRRLGTGLNTGASGDAAFQQPFVQSGQTGTNLLAIIPGRDLPNEYVIVGAHYDHLDTRSDGTGHCFSNGAPGGGVCNGATDNAAGVAAALAIGKALHKLPTPPRRSVILALWDAEEDGLLGSLYYVQHPIVPLAATKAYINFDIQGANILPSLRDTSFAVSAETGGSAMQALIDEAVVPEGLGTRQLSFLFGQLRSDYANLVNGGVPTVFFTDANGGCYHTVNDDPKIVDYGKLTRQSHIAFRATATLAELGTPPTFVPPNPALAVFTDAVRVADLVHLGQADAALFSPTDQAALAGVDAQLQGIVAAGPAAFDATAVGTLLGSAIQVVDLLRHVPCQKF